MTSLPSSIALCDRHELLRRAFFVRTGPLRAFVAAIATLPRRATLARALLLPFATRWPFRTSLRRRLGRRLSLTGRLLLRPTSRSAARLLGRLRPLGARRDHRQRHAPALLIDRRHPHPHLVAHRHHVVRIADVAALSWLMCTRPLSDRPTSTNAPKSTTLSTVPRSSMPGLQVFELHDVLAEDRRRQILARVAARLATAPRSCRPASAGRCPAPSPAPSRSSGADQLADAAPRCRRRPPPPARRPISPAASRRRRSSPDESRWRRADCRRRRSSGSRPPARTSRRPARSLPTAAAAMRNGPCCWRCSYTRRAVS